MRPLHVLYRYGVGGTMLLEEYKMKTAITRTPAVAGMFYPSTAYELQSDVEAYMAKGRGLRPATCPKAIIAPHAGYAYSGPVAGSAFACLRNYHTRINHVVLLGPSHRVAFRGMALSSADAFQTPLGAVELHKTAATKLSFMEFVNINDRAHRDEHCLEVELPFLQCVLDDFTITPIVVGDATAVEVSIVIENIWGGEETLVVASSDLSHYLPYRQAQAIDAATSCAIMEMTPEQITPDMACGRLAIQGLLIAAKKHQLKPTALDVRNSGDTAGDKQQVVGYGAYVFSP